MNDLLNHLFSLDGLGFGDDGVRFAWGLRLSPWLWATAAIFAGTVAYWSYRKLPGSRLFRVVLGAVRTITVLLIVALLCAPHLERPNTRTEQDWIAFVIDRSASMTTPDAPANQTRETQLRAALEGASTQLGEITANKRIAWIAFDGSAWDLQPTDQTIPDFAEPDGRSTSLAAALAHARHRLEGHPVSAVILLTDGRSIDDPGRAALDWLASTQTPIFTVPLGSLEPIADMAIARVDAPRRTYIKDAVPVRVDLDYQSSAGTPLAGTIELVDQATGVVLAARDLSEAAQTDTGRAHITLTARADDPGNRTWSVRVRTNAPDLIESNNTASVTIELVDEPLRVLYLDGQPRWEHRYLKNLLLREPTIVSSNLLLSTDRRFTQDSDELLASLPVTGGEWGAFDVIILGDFRADLLGTEQLTQLGEHIERSGAGLLWIGGPSGTPSSWHDTPLGDLLPVRAKESIASWDEDVVLVRTDAADRLGLLALADSGSGWPDRLSDPDTGWSRLRWAQHIEPSRVKPTAVALANARPASAPFDPSLERPAALFMRYGSGRVVYIATDETWRWRYGRGEDLQERFWLPLVRTLARGRLARAGRPASIEISTDLTPIDQPVRISVEVYDESLLTALPETITLDAGLNAKPPARITLTRSTDAPAHYAGLWVPPEPGAYTIRPSEPALSGLGLEASVRAVLPDDERRVLDTDHPRLIKLADRTGGRVIEPSELASIGSLLPNRSVVIAGDPDTQTLWDRPLTLALLVFLLTLEWLGRKLLRLA